MFVRDGSCEVKTIELRKASLFGGAEVRGLLASGQEFQQISGVNLTRYPLMFDRRDPGWGILLLRWVYRRSPTPSRAAGPLGWTTPWGTQWGQLDGLWGLSP